MHCLRVLIVMLLVATFAVPAAAQAPEPSYALDVVEVGRPIVPATDVELIPYTFTVTCETGTPYATLDPVKFTMAATSDVDWAVVTVSPSQHFLNVGPDECVPGTTRTFEGSARVTLGVDAPAGADVPLALAVHSENEEVASVSWNETVGTFHNAQARFATAILKAPQGADVPLRLTVENFGNGAITPRFTLGEETSGELDVTLPEPRSVPAGATTTFNISVETPSGALYENRRDNVVLSIVPESDVDGSAAEPIQRNAVIQTQGSVADEAPPAPMVPMLVLFVLAAWAARRR